jgi:hypothetical protein
MAVDRSVDSGNKFGIENVEAFLTLPKYDISIANL